MAPKTEAPKKLVFEEGRTELSERQVGAVVVPEVFDIPRGDRKIEAQLASMTLGVI